MIFILKWIQSEIQFSIICSFFAWLFLNLCFLLFILPLLSFMIASARSKTSRFKLYAHVRPINRENTIQFRWSQMVWLNDLGDCFESSWRELLALTILLFDSCFFLLRTYVICLHFIVYWNVRLDLVSVDWMPIDCRWQGKRNVNHTHTNIHIH